MVLKWLKRLMVGVLLIVTGFYGYLYYLLGTSSVTNHGSVDLDTGNIRVPSERTRVWAERSALTDSVLLRWSQREIKDWAKDGKMRIPRILIAKLATRSEIPFVNQYLQEREVRGTVGSTGPWHKTGDYDFTLAGLTLLLYRFGDDPDVLYPETVDHIVDVLMTQQGGDPIIWTPRVLGLPLRDTENHILMTEGSRYLKNRWKALHGDTDPKYDNVANGLEAYLLEYLDEIKRAGYHEYNSRPYQGYTLTALMNIEAFASPRVSESARYLLDRTNWHYVISGVNMRRLPPFRRQPGRAKDTHLDSDYLTGMMKAWMSTGGMENLFIRAGDHQALWCTVLPYRPSDTVAEWIERKPSEYFIRMGHGEDGSPEIYSGGPGYVISAGGVANDRFNQAVARPTTLILDDGTNDLKDVLHVAGPGGKFRGWNNTGVHENFAVSAGPVTVPESWRVESEDDTWRIYQRSGLDIAVHSADSLGVFYIRAADNPALLLEQLSSVNDQEQLNTQFTDPGGRIITYDPRAQKDKWVIVSVDGKEVQRDHGTWPLMAGDLPRWDAR